MTTDQAINGTKQLLADAGVTVAKISVGPFPEPLSFEDRQHCTAFEQGAAKKGLPAVWESLNGETTVSVTVFNRSV